MNHSHEHHSHESDGSTKVAVNATLHCLTGCAIGEVIGLVIGAAFGLGAATTVFLAIGLAFLFGYALSAIPLLKSGLPLRQVVPIVLVADTLSIAVMEVTDNAVMLVLPGAMDAGLVNPIFWLSMPVALTVAFFAALPVNKYLIKRGRGHAVIHAHHG